MYKINKWIPVSFDENTTYPMVYIKADVSLLEFIDTTNGKGIAKITGTFSSYDRNMYTCSVNKANMTPTLDVGDIEEDELYVVTLHTPWIKKPNTNGKIEFSPLTKTSLERFRAVNKNSNNSNNKSYIYYIAFGIIIFLGILFILGSRKLLFQ